MTVYTSFSAIQKLEMEVWERRISRDKWSFGAHISHAVESTARNRSNS